MANPFLDPIDAVAAVVRGINASRDTLAALDRAETMLLAAMEKSKRRVGFLKALASEKQEGRLSQEAYSRLLTAAARSLKEQFDHAEECGRIINSELEDR